MFQFIPVHKLCPHNINGWRSHAHHLKWCDIAAHFIAPGLDCMILIKKPFDQIIHIQTNESTVTRNKYIESTWNPVVARAFHTSYLNESTT